MQYIAIIDDANGNSRQGNYWLEGEATIADLREYAEFTVNDEGASRCIIFPMVNWEADTDADPILSVEAK